MHFHQDYYFLINVTLYPHNLDSLSERIVHFYRGFVHSLPWILFGTVILAFQCLSVLWYDSRALACCKLFDKFLYVLRLMLAAFCGNMSLPILAGECSYMGFVIIPKSMFESYIENCVETCFLLVLLAGEYSRTLVLNKTYVVSP